MGEGSGITFRGVAGLVVFGEVLEVLVLDPRHPALVLRVVLLLGPLHCFFGRALDLAELLLAGRGRRDVLYGSHGV